jgi:acetyl-CoA decarbonylase/synthase complex subunit delta
MEVWDKDPSEDWAEAAKAPFAGVLGDSAAWARKCVQEYGAEMIVVQTKSADPNGDNLPAAEVATKVKKVVDAVDVPVVVWGVANHDKDVEVMRQVAESCSGRRAALCPVEEGDYKQIGAACLGYKHVTVASTPIDVNLGVGANDLIIDPTTGGLGYGLEYTYSVIERIQQAALTQEDEKLQQPIIVNVANETWKCKESNLSAEEAPELGDPAKRGILMEAITAVDLLIAGADVVIMRHPEAVKLVRSYIAKMM